MTSVRITTEWGPSWLVHDGGGVVETRLPGSPPPGDEADDPPAAIASLCRSLEDYFRTGRGLPRPVLAGGETFRDRVPAVVASIPADRTAGDAAVAVQAGRPGAARAVGGVRPANRPAPVVPCHRVVGSDGALRGYAGGVAMKRANREAR